LKILVLSDSHGWNDAMLEAIELESPDTILHLGDKYTDCADIEREYPNIPLRAVRGNSDFGPGGLDTDEFVLEGKRFFMTHGHLYGVKLGKTRILNAAISNNIDILLFGHTHLQYFSESSGLIALNPGCVGLNIKCYAILEIKDGAVTCELKRL